MVVMVEDFINAYGVKTVIKLLNKYPNSEGFEFKGEIVFRSDLEKVYEAYDTVETFGGLNKAKARYNNKDTTLVSHLKLKKAIETLESFGIEEK